MRARVLGLQFDRLAVHLRGASMCPGLGPVGVRSLRIGGGPSSANRIALVLEGAGLSLARPLLASACGVDVLLIGHTCRVPSAARRNQTVGGREHASWPPQSE